MMGKLGGIVLILMLLMWCCNTRKTVVEFNLIGSSGMLPELEVNGEEWDIQVDDSGYAKLMLTEGEHGYATLKYGKDRLPLFIEDGMTLRIYIYGDHAKGNIRFEGDGAPKNRYLNSQVMKNLSFDYELDGPEFLGQLKDLIQEQFHYLDTMGFDTAFTEMERNRIKFSTYKALENYPLYHAWSTGNMDYQPDTAYLSCIKKLIKEDEKLLVLKEYQEGMASLVSLISTYHMKELDAYKQVMAQFDYVIHHLTNETLVEFLIDHYAYAYLLGVGIDGHIDDVLRVYDFYVKNPVLRKRFMIVVRKLFPVVLLLILCLRILPGKLSNWKILEENTCSSTCGRLGVFLVAMKIWLGRNWKKSLKMIILCSWPFLVIVTGLFGKSGCERIPRERCNYTWGMIVLSWIFT